jgi:hypothetical protein
MDLPKSKDLKELFNFIPMDFTDRCLNMVAFDVGRVTAADDRFGIFLDNPNKTLNLSDLQTPLTFAQITDLTALRYANKDVAVAWSGGIDSSLIIAALYKHHIPFKVTVLHERCKAENPDMYAWVLANCDIIELDQQTHFNNLYDYLKDGGSIISGDPADQLFPSIRYNLIEGITSQKTLYFQGNRDYGDNLEVLTQSYPDEYFYNNIKQRIEFNCGVVAEHFSIPQDFSTEIFDFFKRRLLLNNIPFKHFYQLKWLVKFVFKYNKNLQRLSRYIKNDFTLYSRAPISFEQYDFFDTLQYQSWAWTNLDKNFETQSTTALTYKMPAKEYVVDVTGLNSQLNLLKMPSL